MGLEEMLSDSRARKVKRQEYRDTYASKGDVRKLEKKLDRTLEEQKNNQNNNPQSMGRKTLGWIGTGFSNIAQSLNSPSDRRRMRIAQMPMKRSDMDIVRKADLHSLKDPSIRNMDIRGKREKVRNRRGR